VPGEVLCDADLFPCERRSRQRQPRTDRCAQFRLRGSRQDAEQLATRIGKDSLVESVLLPMKLHPRHDWNLSPADAIALQQEMRRDIVADRPISLDDVHLIAGVDVSVKDEMSRAAIVVLTFPDFQHVDTVLATAPTPFPYVPGLLSFREGPVLEEAFAELATIPDVFLFDGMGIAHPRRIGIASHMGLWLEKPTIGCGKTRLVGHHPALGEERGAAAPLMHRGEQIGVVLRTRTGCNPLFISPGHLADIDSAAELVLRCAPRFRLPEPIRQAHKAAALGNSSPQS
jgi:deoxyribonuclease V